MSVPSAAAVVMAHADRAVRQFSTFSLGGFLLGVDVLQVQEVIRHQPMTPVPLAPAVVRGLINLRGQIVTAIDLRRRLGLPAHQADEPPMNVVVQTPGGVVSLLVDEVGDVVEVSEDRFEEAPDTLTASARELIVGVYKLTGTLLLVLNVERTIHLGAHDS